MVATATAMRFSITSLPVPLGLSSGAPVVALQPVRGESSITRVTSRANFKIQGRSWNSRTQEQQNKQRWKTVNVDWVSIFDPAIPTVIGKCPGSNAARTVFTQLPPDPASLQLSHRWKRYLHSVRSYGDVSIEQRIQPLYPPQAGLDQLDRRDGLLLTRPDAAASVIRAGSESALNATVSAPNATVEHAPRMKAPFMGLTLQTR